MAKLLKPGLLLTRILCVLVRFECAQGILQFLYILKKKAKTFNLWIQNFSRVIISLKAADCSGPLLGLLEKIVNEQLWSVSFPMSLSHVCLG